MTCPRSPSGISEDTTQSPPDSHVAFLSGFPGHRPPPLTGRYRRVEVQTSHCSAPGQHGEPPGPRAGTQGTGEQPDLWAGWRPVVTPSPSLPELPAPNSTCPRERWPPGTPQPPALLHLSFAPARLTFLKQEVSYPWTQDSCPGPAP